MYICEETLAKAKKTLSLECRQSRQIEKLVSVLADKYKVHPSTIRQWVNRAGKTLPSRQATTPKKATRLSSTISLQLETQPRN